VNLRNINIVREKLIDIDFALKNEGIDEYMLEFDDNFFLDVNVNFLCAVSLEKQLERLHLLSIYTASKLPPSILLCSRYLSITRKFYRK